MVRQRTCERCKRASYNMYGVRERHYGKTVIVCFDCVADHLRRLYRNYGVVNVVVKTFNAPGMGGLD